MHCTYLAVPTGHGTRVVVVEASVAVASYYTVLLGPVEEVVVAGLSMEAQVLQVAERT